MKRYISLILVAAVLITGLVMPASAAENLWLDVLAYSTPNDSGSYFINIKNNVPVSFDFITSEVGYVDFVVQFRTTSVNPSCKIEGVYGLRQLSVQEIDSNIFRFYGNVMSKTVGTINLYFDGLQSAGTDCQFLSFKISPALTYSYFAPVSGEFHYGGGDELSFYYNSPDDYEGVFPVGSSNYNYDDYRSYIDIDSWKSFDYIDLQLFISEMSVSSIAAYIGDINVPITYSYVSGDTALNDKLITLTLDLTNLDRSNDNVLSVFVSGSVSPIDGHYGAFTVIGSSGFTVVSGPDTNLTFWYRIKSFFSDQFNSINSWISSQTSSLVSSLNSIASNITSWGQSIVTSIISVGSDLESWADSIYKNITNVSNGIQTWGQNIVDALSPDTDSASSAVDKADQQAQQVQQNNDALQQMAKPDLSGAGDISGTTYPTNTVKYTLFLNHVMTAPIISEVLTLSLIFSLAAYVLFGKRG